MYQREGTTKRTHTESSRDRGNWLSTLIKTYGHHGSSRRMTGDTIFRTMSYWTQSEDSSHEKNARTVFEAASHLMIRIPAFGSLNAMPVDAVADGVGSR